MIKPILIMPLLLFAILSLFSCGEDPIVNAGDPSNLVVEVTQPEEGSGIVQIQATADNTVSYQLWIGYAEEPVETNTTGTFEYAFTRQGNYQIEVRAYGSSGRYLKEVKQVLVTIGNNVSVGEGYTTPLHYDGYKLIWNDEFDGSSVNTNNWVFEIGDGCPHICGWGNNELQYYRSENAWVSDDVLTIEAREQSFQGRNYTSTRMKTQGKFSFKYGRVDIRALLPKGQGIWPALWMLGNNITSVGWPACGEIDIMELIGGGDGRDNRVHGTVHWDSNGHASAGGSYTLQNEIFADKYHVFTIIWDETFIRWYVNDVKYYEINITPSHMTEFHLPHFFIFNVAVGGNWPGSPNQTTIFPQQLRVDYIRVFQVE
jgi:beta-glucanase (GH16 family)